MKEKYLKRRTAGFVSQFARFAGRSFIQQMRDIRAILIDFFLLFLSGSLLGAVFMNKTYNGPLPEIACRDLKIDVLKDTCDLPLDDPYRKLFVLSNNFCANEQFNSANLRSRSVGARTHIRS